MKEKVNDDVNFIITKKMKKKSEKKKLVIIIILSMKIQFGSFAYAGNMVQWLITFSISFLLKSGQIMLQNMERKID